MKTHISTNKSFLNTYKFENTDLIKECIENIKNKLIIRPSIIVFGRQCNQNRSIGFFSNNSIGYYYSNQCTKSQTLTPSVTPSATPSVSVTPTVTPTISVTRSVTLTPTPTPTSGSA